MTNVEIGIVDPAATFGVIRRRQYAELQLPVYSGQLGSVPAETKWITELFWTISITADIIPPLKALATIFFQ